MKPHQYHNLLLELDRALAVLDDASPDFSIEDMQLHLRLATVRAKVLKAESGYPLELDSTGSRPPLDPDLTPPPWSKMLVSDPAEFPPARVG